MKKPKPCITNYLITESEVVTGKSQTEALPYWPSDSEVNTVGRGLRFSRNDRTVEVIKLFIIWLNGSKERKQPKFKRKSLLHIRWCARLSIHSSFQTVTPAAQQNSANYYAYSVRKIYLFLENNDQYGRKKYFSTVVLLYDERIFIDILKNQPPNVNSYRKVLQTCSKAVWPCRVKENTI